MIKWIALSLFLTTSIGISAASAAVPQHFKKVFIIVLENTDYDEALRQPFLADLSKRGALLSNYSAITHPSQPNYIAMISGSTYRVTSDSNRDLVGRHVGDLLEEHGKNWKVYAEGYPGGCFQGSRGTYVRKHVPFISFKNVQSDPARCARIVDSASLQADIKAGTLPEYSFFVPDLNNDGHDTGAAFADRWLSEKFGPLLTDAKFIQDMLFVVTFDESELFGGNKVFTALFGPGVAAGTVSNLAYTHYSLLRTIEDELGLGTLGLEDAKAKAISDVWK